MSPARGTALWSSCPTCAYARAGGPPCYYHTSKFGVGKLITTIATEVKGTLNDMAEELSAALDDELESLP